MRLAAILLLTSPLACDGGTPSDAGAEATKIWTSRCATCHGATGAGDGPSAAAMNPKPRSFQASAWQASATDAHIKKVIVEGGAAAGLSPSMAPNADLDGNEAVLDALLKKIRGFSG